VNVYATNAALHVVNLLGYNFCRRNHTKRFSTDSFCNFPSVESKESKPLFSLRIQRKNEPSRILFLPCNALRLTNQEKAELTQSCGLQDKMPTGTSLRCTRHTAYVGLTIIQSSCCGLIFFTRGDSPLKLAPVDWQQGLNKRQLYGAKRSVHASVPRFNFVLLNKFLFHRHYPCTSELRLQVTVSDHLLPSCHGLLSHARRQSHV
jgi:hypothetical protein